MSRKTAATIVLAALASGCATKAMRTQAAALAAAGERLEAETAAFTAARTAVVQLRQRSLVQRKQEVAEQGQHNARTVAQWKIAGTEDRAKRLALFKALVDASEAMYEVRDQGLLWEESVLYTRSALAIDRAALHRFVRQLVALSRPTRFIDGVKFYVDYGAQVAAQVDAGLAEVTAAVAAAQAASEPPPPEPTSPPPGTPPVTTPGTPTTPDPKLTQPPVTPDPRPTAPSGPDDLRRPVRGTAPLKDH